MELHDLQSSWDRIADRIRDRVNLSDDLLARLLGRGSFNVAGCDLSFFAEQPSSAVAAVAVLAFPSMRVIRVAFQVVNLTVPYISGYLAFREADPIIHLLELVQSGAPIPQGCPDGSTAPATEPVSIDAVVIDGNGILHPDGVGLGCHIGVRTGLPTIGVAKKLLSARGIDRIEAEEAAKNLLLTHGAEKPREGCLETTRRMTLIPEGTVEGVQRVAYVPLVGADNSTLGAAVVAGRNSKNPTYVSVGHLATIESAVALISAMSRHRVAEPIRVADLESRDFVRKVRVFEAAITPSGAAD